MTRGRRGVALGVVALAVAACAQEEGPAARGRLVYLSQCTACHNTDPAKDGAVGPAIKGSSRELIEARVVHAAYPVGYKPKRSTTIMKPTPQLAPEIDALAAYLK